MRTPAFATVLLLPAVLAATAVAAAPRQSPVRYRDPVFERVSVTRGIVYGTATDIPTGDEVELKLDWYEPVGDTETARPVLVFVHGGGFVGGDRSAGRRYAEDFARRGYVAASISYRLRQGDAYTVGVPAAVSDARQAVRWVREHAAERGVDTSRITIGGSSAGAITSLFVTYTDMERESGGTSSATAAVMDLWGGLYTYVDEMTAGEPPLVIVHGTEDTVVPFQLALDLKARADEVGVPYDYHPLEGVGHGWGNAAGIAEWTAAFFYEQLWPNGPSQPSATPGRPTGAPTRPVRRTPTPTQGRPTRPIPTHPIPSATATATTGSPDGAVYMPWAIKGVTREDLPAPATAPAVTATATVEPTPTRAPGRAPFEPPDGRVYHGASPGPGNVDAYIAALGDTAIAPMVEGSHMGIPGTRPQFFARNVQAFVDRVVGAGRVPHLSFSFTIGEGQPVDDVIADTDTYDAQIDVAAGITAAVDGPVFVRPGFEFNGSWNGYTPGVYPRAFRKFVDRFRAAGADNAIFVWCYMPAGPADFADEAHGEALWYPGDDYVDWFGLDLFDAGNFHPDAPLEDRRGPTTRGRSEAFLEMARAHGKPVFLSEVAAVKIHITDDPADGEADWEAWFGPWFEFLESHPEIKGFNIMSQDYTGTKYDEKHGWANARLQDNPVVLARWVERMGSARYVHLTRTGR